VLKEKMDKEDAELVKRLHQIKTQIEAHPIEFDLKGDEKGNLYGAVTKEAILKALREHKFLRTEHADVHIEHPIKSVGEYTVEVDLKKGVTATMKVVVRIEKER
jgi:ribosomal protein L9